ncbi:stromal membrane-associated protein 1-like isoform X2 [Genypterus blacodes]|uniref:stromal membrane-associated protein 1-like isoform X2 n=1 Tax=Genypterus blacodes TaxID=154954 RepID=UPI003F76D19A
MTTRSEREKAQKLNEQHQAILSKMLREEDNKYCADCEAKGPRWASWNLGVFICIRCAGIHRNLGVHISRVKSVNLDQWTSEQIQSIQDMGNTRARQLYEANLPESFRRPQTDQPKRAVEYFIRDKYEKKKYYSKSVTNGGSPKDVKKDKEAERVSKVSSYTKSEESRPVPKISPAKISEPSVNLLGLDTPAAASANNGSTSTTQNNNSNDLDIFGPMVSNPLPASSSTAQFSQVSSSNTGTPTQVPAAGAGGSGSGSAQGDLDLFSDSSSTAKGEEGAKKPLSKDSILSLYGTNSMAQQPATGMFMGPSQMQFPVQAAPGYQPFPGMGAAMPPATVMGAMMAQSGAAMMAPNAGMMVGMTMPNGFMANAPAAGVMGMAPRMMGPQAGAMHAGAMHAGAMHAGAMHAGAMHAGAMHAGAMHAGAMHAGMVPAQGMYAIQPGQQAQWNMGQVNQQMSGLALNGPGAQMAFGQPPSAMGGWAGAGSGQTLSTQLWK